MADRRLSQSAMDYYNRAQSGSGGVTDYGYYIDPATGRAVQRIDGGGYAEYAPRAEGKYFEHGDSYGQYDNEGKYLQDQKFGDESMKEAMMMFLASVGGMQFLPGGLMNSAAAAGSANGMWDVLPEAISAGGGVPPNPFLGMSQAEALTAAGMAPAAASAGTTAATTAATTTGKSLLSSAPSWLGPAATVAGALLGGKGNEQSATSERKMDPRLDPYVFGEKGVVPMAHGLLQQQMPIAQQYGQQMGQVGQGLLNMPAAGNGFGLFTRNRYGS